ncbi:MAG: ComEC/Rec2 family competence protein [Clostridia bacterium]|nr:ComEC/Rec2 family competence protein [Clostridia bacterium]
MRDFLLKRPMLLSALCASAVSVIGLYAEKALFIFCIGILIFLFVIIYKRVRSELIFALLVIFAVALSTLFSVKRVESLKRFDNCSCSGEFIVVEEPVNHGDFYTASLEAVKSDCLSKGTKVNIVYYDGEMEFSQRINANVTLSTFEDYKLKFSFYSNGVFLDGRVNDFEYTGENDIVLNAVGRVREYIKNNIFEFYGKSEAATMLALLTGDRSYFTDRFYSNVKSAGVAHVMVVSGMHLSVIVSLFLYLINKLVYNRYLKALVVVAVTFAVMIVCGFTMSIQRAGFTYLFLALSLLLNRESTPENTLGCAVCTVLIINPYAIMNVAFQLSVLSTFAILAVAIPITEYVKESKIIKNELLLSLFSSIVISLSALIFTAPVTTYIFGYVSNVSLITNLLISTAATLALILCILGFLLPFAKTVLFGAGSVIVNYINAVINYFGSLSFATTQTDKKVTVYMIVVIIAILWTLVACKNYKDMLKLKEIRLKKYKEGGGKVKWQ